MSWTADWLRAIAEQFVESALTKAGITSADKYYHWLREAEVPVPRAIVRDVWREYKKSYEWLDIWYRAPGSFRLPRGWMSEIEGDYYDNYNYKFKLHYRDPETGATREGTYLLKRSFSLSKDETEDELYPSMEDSDPALLEDLEYVELIAVYHKRGAPY